MHNLITCFLPKDCSSPVDNCLLIDSSTLQFVQTDEAKLLEYATLELQKVSSVKEDDKERHYIDSLLCFRQSGRKEVKLRLIQAIFFSIGTWCDCKLQDYHLHFSQVSCYSFIKFLYILFTSWLLPYNVVLYLTVIFLIVRLLFQQPGNFKRVMTLVSTVGIPIANNYGEIKVSLLAVFTVFEP